MPYNFFLYHLFYFTSSDTVSLNKKAYIKKQRKITEYQTTTQYSVFNDMLSYPLIPWQHCISLPFLQNDFFQRLTKEKHAAKLKAASMLIKRSNNTKKNWVFWKKHICMDLTSIYRPQKATAFVRAVSIWQWGVAISYFWDLRENKFLIFFPKLRTEIRVQMFLSHEWKFFLSDMQN